MAAKRTSFSLPQVAALIVLALGVIVCCMHLIVIVGGGVGARDELMFHGGVAAAALGLGVGISAIIAGLEALLRRQPVLPAELVEALGAIHRSITHLTTTVQRHQDASSSATAHLPPPEPFPRETFDRIGILLEDIRELSMMNEHQRQSAYRQHVELQKQEALGQFAKLVQDQQWGQADQLLQRLEAQFANDPAVARSRQELEAARGAVEAEAFTQTRQRVESLMTGSSWDQALIVAQRFADDFPRHADGQQLLSRVIRERDLFRESAVGRLNHEIRAEIDNRNWRQALSLARSLIEMYPDHPRTHLIRQQLKTIEDNAEIEERQEQEVRIQELVRARRFQEAIDLAEQLIDRYPNSPQAESLEKLLPQMRDMMHGITDEDDDEVLIGRGTMA